MSVLNDSLYDELNDESYFKIDESYDITESDEPFPIINRYFKIYD